MSKITDVERPKGVSTPWLIVWKPSEDLNLRIAVHDGPSTLIHRENDLPQVVHNGKVLIDPKEMREGVVPTTHELLEQIKKRHNEEEILAFVGNGNLTANYDFVAWIDGRLFFIEDESVFKKLYTCIVVWKRGNITVEDIRFARENGDIRVLRHHTPEDITDQVEWATSGQPLVRNGEAIPLHEIAHLFYDARHLISPLRIAFNDAVLFFPQAQLQEGLLRKAVCGPIQVIPEAHVDEETVIPLTVRGWLDMRESNPSQLKSAQKFFRQHGIIKPSQSLCHPKVFLETARLCEQLLIQSLKEAGYEIVDHSLPLKEGQARFINGHLEIYFRKAIYPHNMFVRFKDGRCGFLLFPGKSGREGTTIPFAQWYLTEVLGVEDALLLDNGGDVRLWYRGQYLLPPFNGREEIRSILALTTRRGSWPEVQVR